MVVVSSVMRLGVGGERQEGYDDAGVREELLDVGGEVVNPPHHGLVAVPVPPDLVGDVVVGGGGQLGCEGVPVGLDAVEVLAHAAVVSDALVDVVEGCLPGEVDHGLELLELLGGPLIAGASLGVAVLDPAVEDLAHVVEVVALVLGPGNGLLGAELVGLGDGGGGLLLALGVALVGALDAEEGAALLLALGGRGLEEGLVLGHAVRALGEDLEAVEGLPHPDDLALVGSRPQVMGAERPVVEGLLGASVLDTDGLTADVEHLLRPVGVHRAHELVPGGSALPDLRADALTDAERVPGELVHDPEVRVLVNDLAGDVSDDGLAVKVEAEGAGLATNVVVLGSKVGAVAELAHGVIGGDDGEAEGVRLLADEDLIVRVDAPLLAPLGGDGRGDVTRIGHHRAGGESDLVILISSRNTTDTLAWPARGIVVGVVTSSQAIPVVRVSISLGCSATQETEECESYH
mmetsp:Transcript_11270/g.22842  ORF Transcript_11270/g.22842 Transcript_11270/m.22842 type:complete len:462 (+) Transcript_11270:180-1565(+)